jgi:cell pole-organizing protein PopZ
VSEPEEPQEPEPGDSLLSATTGASVSSAFSALTTTMFLQNTGMVEEAVRELLRPMLKQWLDDNLPVMVERLVRAEIERVARGGR